MPNFEEIPLSTQEYVKDWRQILVIIGSKKYKARGKSTGSK